MCIERLLIFSIKEKANNWAVFRHRVLMVTSYHLYLVNCKINQTPTRHQTLHHNRLDRNGALHHDVMTMEMWNLIVIKTD